MLPQKQNSKLTSSHSEYLLFTLRKIASPISLIYRGLPFVSPKQICLQQPNKICLLQPNKMEVHFINTFFSSEDKSGVALGLILISSKKISLLCECIWFYVALRIRNYTQECSQSVTIQRLETIVFLEGGAISH